jgi:hypothetical protein
MRRVILSAFLLLLSSCSDLLESGDGLPSDLIPSQVLLAVRVANPGALDAELQDLGAPPLETILPFLGLGSLDGIDLESPWYLFWSEDAEPRESPLILLPLSDETVFTESWEGGANASEATVRDEYVLLVSGDFPQLGNSSLDYESEGDVGLHADIGALRAAYSEELEEARNQIRSSVESAVPTTHGPQPVPGFDPTGWGQLMEAEVGMFLDILEQSADLNLSFSLNEGDLAWSVVWTLDPDSPWGELVARQDPKEPTGLGRVNLDRPMIFWMAHDLSENQELLQPFFDAISNMMTGIDSDVFSSLTGQEMEGVMSMGWEGKGMVMEAVYSLPGARISEYRDLVRDLMAGVEFDVPGAEMEYREGVTRIGDVEVDVLVQGFDVPETQASSSIPLARAEVSYGWGEDEVFVVMEGGEDLEGGIERLGALISRQPTSVPDPLQASLDACPEKLMMFGYMDLAGLMDGIAATTPGGAVGWLPADLPPVTFYATAERSRVIYGGSMDLGAMVSGATDAGSRCSSHRNLPCVAEFTIT